MISSRRDGFAYVTRFSARSSSRGALRPAFLCNVATYITIWVPKASMNQLVMHTQAHNPSRVGSSIKDYDITA